MIENEIKSLPNTSGIYMFVNNINGKVYIGKASNLKLRLMCHLKEIKRNDKLYLYNALKKYGIENFTLKILIKQTLNDSDLNELEIDFIRLYNSNDSRFGYNLTIGGEGCKGMKHSEKMSNSHKRENLSDETRLKLSLCTNRRIYKPLSEETKQKIRIGLLGKPSPTKGIKRSKETCEKMSKSMLGKTHTEESKRKISQGNKGKVYSEQAKKKISDKAILQHIEQRKIREDIKNVKVWVYDWIYP